MRICQLNLTDSRTVDPEALARTATLGFDHVLLAGWAIPHIRPDLLASTFAACRSHGLLPLLDLSLDRFPAEAAAMHDGWVDHARPAGSPDATDSHLPGVRLRWYDEGLAPALVAWWSAQIREAIDAGAAGFCCRAPSRVPGRHWAEIIETAGRGSSKNGGDPVFLAFTPGTHPQQLADLALAPFDGAFCSLPWWDYRSAWLTEEMARLRPFGRVLAAPALAPDGTDVLAARRALWTAAAIGDGLMVPAGFETGAQGSAPEAQSDGHPDDIVDAPYDLTHELIQCNAWLAARDPAPAVAVRQVSGPDAPLTVLARLPRHLANGSNGSNGATGPSALTVVLNPSPIEPASFGADRVLSALPQAAATLRSADGGPGGTLHAANQLDPSATITLAPADIRLYEALPVSAQPRARRNGSGNGNGNHRKAIDRDLATAMQAPRVAIENLAPTADHGRFAVRRTVGERVEVTADIWMDGHDKLAAAVLWRAPGEQVWHASPMEPVINDRWRGSFPIVALGRHEFTVEAWRDTFASWLDEIGKKRKAGVDVTLEIEEGARLVAATLDTPEGSAIPDAGALLAELKAAAGDDALRLEILLSPRTGTAMHAAMDTPAGRPFISRHPTVMPVEADRLAARFASWYELFPRSESGDENRHGTFDDVIRRLPAIRAMGFDVLYFPPIHPIGQAHRKGRNNSLKAEPGDVGSPYAIGSAEGGHDALHPQLGTFEDFQRLRRAAADHGLELALDFAIQCSPDHPWLREHPEWFSHRPDGTLRYAENPPKKYEDIVNVDFYAPPPAGEHLWQALRDVVMFWADQGVRIFRVDNPHTKPLPFWEWMIADVRAKHPDTLFLAEAFTRPKMMARLAKLGFSQSYTYFTWRNTKAELTEYMTELTQTPLREFYRPHFFVNTPDINPYFLHDGGRPAFLIRAALAALLSGLWGMYNGFEVCEGAPLVLNGVEREEYLDSEKYQIRVRDWNQPGNIVAEISRLNQIRASHPALQDHLGVRFYHASDDAVLYFARYVPAEPGVPAGGGGGGGPGGGKPGSGPTFGSDVLLVAISLDPRAPRESAIELPLWEWGLPDHGTLQAEELMSGRRFTWTGKAQRIRLNPHELPFALWHVRPQQQTGDTA
ncbi:alpha-1,4-glucan--maltose-1-phosphate maltosyltransferase [Cupriavidus campinensis]|uniref:Alpha-1,4-glucan:maltose-1-phosphate maltosyltransferase n=1 Tax=Cupriavidus campinensis TaxID=151783 RepID=A0AAE9L570_9BURK|nr:alpha-1,4-glucan--maltose-1-phosphate maltosyltransferase [Cupriavidus campinensis]URF07648.1 alpha-1,4-glucan--maltose-1-phosphate maltosyltransferase [Cupriavidus campinensis]